MRILTLRFANINSLAGEWAVNFEDPAFRDGLFALTGPTGSGKTSVLDALSLALYGRTVRQKVSKEANEVMTRGAGSASAEVAFETGGQRYLCTWSQHRARSKAGGNLQAAKRTLARLPEGRILCERLAEIDAAVAAVTGMTFEQFTRSVLLAQGQFDAFLKAKDDERSDILEQVTGTEIFSEVGAAVFARYQRERDRTALLGQHQAFLQVLDAEARAGLLLGRGAAQQAKQTLETEVVRLQSEQAWLDNLDTLRAQRARLLNEQAQHDARVLHMRPELERLVLADAARALDAAYAKFDAVRKLAWRRVRAWETRSVDGKAAEAELAGWRRELAAADTVCGTRDSSALTAEARRFPLVKTALILLEAKRAHAAALPVLDRLRAERDASAKERVRAENERAARKPDVESALKLAREKTELVKRVASLEEQRALLIDGQPCPLCGATGHPYSSGIPLPGLAAAQAGVDAIEQTLGKLEHEADAARLAAEAADRALRLQETVVQAGGQDARDAQNRFDVAREELKTRIETGAAVIREVGTVTAEMTAELAAAGFADEGQWKAARWTDREVERVRRGKTELSEQGSSLKGRFGDVETALRQKENEALSTRPKDEVDAELKEKRQALESVLQRLADLQAALKADDEALERRREQGEALAAQKTVFAKWETLNGWIGGENGARFKRYAQGITLRRLLQVANPHLTRMTRGRYVMVWEESDQGLLPAMIDREQGDVRRAVSNLSGGETFLVSLALALGLANMASGKLRVDSLFLDEGFGALDEDALDTALETLSGLQQQGKLIGVISHVPAIKERIRTQIQIQPQAGGHSILRGAGVA